MLKVFIFGWIYKVSNPILDRYFPIQNKKVWPLTFSLHPVNHVLTFFEDLFTKECVLNMRIRP